MKSRRWVKERRASAPRYTLKPAGLQPQRHEAYVERTLLSAAVDFLAPRTTLKFVIPSNARNLLSSTPGKIHP